MVEEQDYQLIITSTAERSYFETLDYVFDYHSLARANKIAIELLEYPQILLKYPNLGVIEPYLKERAETYRFLTYERTTQKTVKIIYYVDEATKKIVLTDFFPSEMDTGKIKKR